MLAIGQKLMLEDTEKNLKCCEFEILQVIHHFKDLLLFLIFHISTGLQ